MNPIQETGHPSQNASTIPRQSSPARPANLTPAPPPQQPKLLDRVREAIRLRHYSRRTEKAYVGWIKRFIFFHGVRHPAEMGKDVDFASNQILVRTGKGDKDRMTLLPLAAKTDLARHLVSVRTQHGMDLGRGAADRDRPANPFTTGGYTLHSKTAAGVLDCELPQCLGF